MWGTFLSEPLRIVGLVGRCPTNYLMRRMPIRDRGRPLWPAGDVPSRHYVVLGGISPGYPSVTARLHTCYSPVRRSPAAESKLPAPLPLDLHVLSLSLAFILSQDQTLHSIKFLLNVSFAQSYFLRFFQGLALAVCFKPFNIFKELLSHYSLYTSKPEAKADAKIILHIYYLQIFSELFSNFFSIKTVRSLS